jgi:hypothetical protein
MSSYTDSTNIILQSTLLRMSQNAPLEQLKPDNSPLGTDAAVSGLIGIIFIFLGLGFGIWLVAQLSGQGHDTHVQWTSGPDAGKSVPYFALQGGTAWLEMGQFVLGVMLLIESALLGLAVITAAGVKTIRRAIVICLCLSIAGAGMNALAVVMQIRMGFTQPIMSVIAFALAGYSAFTHAVRLKKQI